MRRLAGAAVGLWFLALGTGLVGHLHDLQHDRDDAALIAMARASGAPMPVIPKHDESNCLVHALLHLPMITAAWVPLLVLVGLFIAFLTMLRPAPVMARLPVRIDCRGPPGGG